MKLTDNESKELTSMLHSYLKHKNVQEMQNYIQHGNISTYNHSLSVCRLSFLMNRRFCLNANENTLVVGALLHDFYLYDWHNEDNGTHNLHGYIHAERARQNAVKYFDADHEVQEVIRTHMWPLNLTKVPKTKEAWIVCFADKIVSTKETLFMRN